MQHMDGEIDRMTSSQYMTRLNSRIWKSDKEKVYLSKNGEHWCRSKVLDMSPDGEHAQVYFIDYGNYKIVKVSISIFFVNLSCLMIIRSVS